MLCLGYIYVKIKFFVFYVLSGCPASMWRDLLKLNLFASSLKTTYYTTKTTELRIQSEEKKKGPLFFGRLFLTPLFLGVTLPFFLSIANLCF